MDFEKVDKLMLLKHREKGKKLKLELDGKLEEFKLRSLAFFDLQKDLAASWHALKKYLGENYKSWVDGKYKVPDGSKFLPLENKFLSLAAKKFELQRDNYQVHSRIKVLRKQRDKHSTKIFRYYKLDKTQVYRFNFGTGEMFKLIRPKTPVKNAAEIKPAKPN